MKTPDFLVPNCSVLYSPFCILKYKISFKYLLFKKSLIFPSLEQFAFDRDRDILTAKVRSTFVVINDVIHDSFEMSIEKNRTSKKIDTKLKTSNFHKNKAAAHWYLVSLA